MSNQPSRTHTGAFIAEAGKLHHQIRAEGSEAVPFLGSESLPAIEAHQRGVGAKHGAIGQTETRGAAKYLPSPLVVGPEQQAHLQPGIAGAGFTACGCHRENAAISGEFEHGIAALSAEQRELIRREPQAGGKPQRRAGDRACKEGQSPQGGDLSHARRLPWLPASVAFSCKPGLSGSD